MPTVNDFLATLGINTHVDATTTTYGDLTLVESALAYLGFSLIRDHAYDFALPAFHTLAQAGIRFDLITDGAKPATAVKAFAPLGTAIASFEGANEVDLFPVESAATLGPVKAAVQEQQLLFAAVRALPQFNTTPVLNETVGDPANIKAYAAAAASSDILNVHAYANTDAPLTTILATVKIETGSSPKGIALTETGYDTLPSDPQGVDESVQARYTLDSLFDAFNRGLTATYLYELLDEAPDPAGTDPQLHYGLFHADGSPKLAAVALHDLTSILSSLPAGTAPITVSPTITAPASVHSLALDGNTTGVIAVWAEPPLWDPTTQTEIPMTPTTIGINLGTIAAFVSVYDPLLGTAPIATYAQVSQIGVDVTDHPLIIEATAAATVSAAPPPPSPPDPAPAPIPPPLPTSSAPDLAPPPAEMSATPDAASPDPTSTGALRSTALAVKFVVTSPLLAQATAIPIETGDGGTPEPLPASLHVFPMTLALTTILTLGPNTA